MLRQLGKFEIRRVLGPRHRFDPTDRNAVAMWDTTLQTLMFGRMIDGMRSFFTVVGLVTQPERDTGRKGGSTRQTGKGMANIAREAGVPVVRNVRERCREEPVPAAQIDHVHARHAARPARLRALHRGAELHRPE